MSHRQKNWLKRKEELLWPQRDFFCCFSSPLTWRGGDNCHGWQSGQTILTCTCQINTPDAGKRHVALDGGNDLIGIYCTFITTILILISTLTPLWGGGSGGARWFTNSCVLSVQAELKWLVFDFAANIQFCFQDSNSSNYPLWYWSNIGGAVSFIRDRPPASLTLSSHALKQQFRQM